MTPPSPRRSPAYRPVARAAGLVAVVVSLFYLATVNERMLEDARTRAASAHDLAHRCLAKPGAEPDYAAVVRLEARIFKEAASTCPPAGGAAGS